MAGRHTQLALLVAMLAACSSNSADCQQLDISAVIESTCLCSDDFCECYTTLDASDKLNIVELNLGGNIGDEATSSPLSIAVLSEQCSSGCGSSTGMDCICGFINWRCDIDEVARCEKYFRIDGGSMSFIQPLVPDTSAQIELSNIRAVNIDNSSDVMCISAMQIVAPVSGDN